jgi:hypothetical protein
VGDTYSTVRAAAVQASSVFLDREASTDVGPDGSYLGKHAKLMPTAGERLAAHGGDTFGAIQTESPALYARVDESDPRLELDQSGAADYLRHALENGPAGLPPGPNGDD